MGLDLCVLLHAAPTMAELLAQPPPLRAAWPGGGGAPCHLLCHAWGSRPSGKAKRARLDAVAASPLLAGLGCGRRLGGMARARLYLDGPAPDGGTHRPFRFQSQCLICTVMRC